MKPLLVPLVSCALLGACAYPVPVAPPYFLVAQVPREVRVVPQYVDPDGDVYRYDAYAWPYGYVDPYAYAYAPYWYPPLMFTGTFFCCTVSVPRQVHRFHGTHRWSGAHGGSMGPGRRRP